jgi:hypothetical protein
MAQQKGIIPLQGTIGNITFYKSKDGFMAREKGSLNADRIANDHFKEPVRTEQNLEEREKRVSICALQFASYFKM